MPMIVHIFLNHFRCYFIPYSSHKISIFPKLPSPQLPLHLRMPPEYFLRTNTFECPHYLSYKILWWYASKYMDMILRHLYLLYLTVSCFQYLSKQFFRQFPNLILQYPLAILRCPYQMIFCIIYCMAYTSQTHVTYYIPLQTKGNPFLPMLPHGVSRVLFS